MNVSDLTAAPAESRSYGGGLNNNYISASNNNLSNGVNGVNGSGMKHWLQGGGGGGWGFQNNAKVAAAGDDKQSTLSR